MRIFLFIIVWILLTPVVDGRAVDQIGPVDPTEIDRLGDIEVGSIDYLGPIDWLPKPGDKIRPLVSITTGDPQTIDTDSLSVAWVATDNVGIVECKWALGGPPNATTGTVESSSPASTSGYAPGENSLFVGCRDSEENWGWDSITVTYTAGIQYADIEVSWNPYDPGEDENGSPIAHTGFLIYSAASQFGFEQMPDNVIATAGPDDTSVVIEHVQCGKYIGVVAYGESDESDMSAETPSIDCD